MTTCSATETTLEPVTSATVILRSLAASRSCTGPMRTESARSSRISVSDVIYARYDPIQHQR